MKIALIIPELHQHGGTERCMTSLAEALHRRGHTLVVFSARRDPAVLPSARWWRVPMLPRPHLLRFLSFFLLHPLVRLIAALQGERFDLILSTGPDVLRPDVSIFHCCAASIVQQLHSGKGFRSRFSSIRRLNIALTYRPIAWLERYVARAGAAKVIAVSHALRSELVNHYDVPAARVSVLPDGVDTAAFSPPTPEARQYVRESLSIAARDLVVLFVGHCWERKGLETLITAVKILRDQSDAPVILLVVGGKCNPAYEADAISRLHGRCSFLGKRGDMPNIYAAADVCVLPSDLESFGLPILEAMSCGVPGIVTATAGVAEVIADGDKGLLLSDPHDAQELAAKLLCLVSDRERFRSMGLRARATAEKYSWDGLARQFERICERSADSDLSVAA